MQYRHDRETTRAGVPAGRLALSGTLLALVSALAAVQAASADAELPVAQTRSDIVRAGGAPSGLSSDFLHLAIHVNREEVEGDDEPTSGSSASEEHDRDEKTGDGDREEVDDGDDTSSES